MNGFVDLDINSGIALIEKCKRFIEKPVAEKVKTERRFSFKKMRMEEYSYTTISASWYADKTALLEYLEDLKTILYQGNDIKLSLISYLNLIKLSQEDNSANALHILHY